jgi:Rha family phage regulatory protein
MIRILPENGEFYVTSLQVAGHFEKEHKHILEAIRAVEELEPKFCRPNFRPSNYFDVRGKNQPMYKLTRDGFSFLAMGFTGVKANKFKIQYLAAFNAMEKELLRIGDPKWIQQRLEAKGVRRIETDAIKEFIDYAISQGSETYLKSPSLAYSNFTKMEYKFLFLLTKAIPNLRDKLNWLELGNLKQAEFIVAKTIREDMEKGIFYKQIFQNCKNKIETYVNLVGVVDKRNGVLLNDL